MNQATAILHTSEPGKQTSFEPVHSNTLPVLASQPLASELSTGPAVCDVAAYGLAAQALEMLLADTRSEETKRAYRRDLQDFFASRNQETTPAAVHELCSLPAGPLALVLNSYKAHLRGRKLSEATVNRRLAALRSLLRMARRLGASCADPSGLVTSEKVTAYRDTRGPGLADARKLLAAPDRSTLTGKRDYCLLLVMCENALRRGELCRCDVADFDATQKRLAILGKGKGSQKVNITLSDASIAALQDYLLARASAGHSITPDAPLFTNRARFTDGNQRLTGRGLAHIVNSYGMKTLGRPLHPHSLRHMAITAALDATDGNVRIVQRLSRHADIRTLQIYDDSRQDLQGEATNLLSDLLSQGKPKGKPTRTPARK